MWENIANMVRRAYVSLTNGDAKQFSTAQVSSNEKVMDVETIYPYGLYAQAPLDSLMLVFCVQGNEENLAGIPYSGNMRFKSLKPGEVLLGNVATQTFIKLNAEGGIDIDAKNDVNINVAGNVNLTANQVTVNSPLTVTDTNFVSLGTGGGEKAIARVGDQIEVTIGMVTYTGTITTGGTNKSN